MLLSSPNDRARAMPDTFPQNNPGPSPDSAGASPLAGKRVLIAEDEGLILLQLRQILTLAGATVEIALATHLDLVLMDINMPGGFDGLEAARRILEVQRTCIVVMTGYSDEEMKKKAQQIGVCGFLVKPVSLATLLPEIEAALHCHGLTHCG